MASEIKTGAILNYVSIVVTLATSFFLTPFVISTLGVEEYGLFMLSHSIIGWLALTDLGLGATVSKYVITYRAKGEHEEQAHFLGQSMLLFCAIGLTVLAVGMGIFNLLWGLYYTLSVLGARVVFRKPDWVLYRGMFVFSVWIFLNQIMDMFYWQAGSPILANVSGTVAVSVFTLGISFSNYFMTATTAISGVLAPKLMHMVALDASKEDLTNVMIRAERLQLFLLSMILLGFFFRRTYLPMLLPALFLVGIGFALTGFWHVEGWTDLFVAIGVYGSLLVLTLFAFYLNREEKDSFLYPIKKILHVH